MQVYRQFWSVNKWRNSYVNNILRTRQLWMINDSGSKFSIPSNSWVFNNLPISQVLQCDHHIHPNRWPTVQLPHHSRPVPNGSPLPQNRAQCAGPLGFHLFTLSLFSNTERMVLLLESWFPFSSSNHRLPEECDHSWDLNHIFYHRILY